LESLRDRFAGLAQRRAAVDAEKAALVGDERTYTQQLDLLRYQTSEIAAARLRSDEEAGLEREHRLASNAARLLELTQSALGQLADEDGGVFSRLGALGRTLQDLARLDPEAGNLTALHGQATLTLRELPGELQRYADRLELDPGRLRELEERLNLVHGLKRKYGTSLADVIAFGEEARQRLLSLEQRDVQLARLKAERARLDAELRQEGEALTARRRRLIPKLEKAVAAQLADLGFQRSHFEVELKTEGVTDPSGAPARLPLSGWDAVEFQFAPNPGEPPRPLRAIASSGEMARVMLALKTVLAAQDDIPVLVFDEVDANVGGETAGVLGVKMQELAARRQVLCITHLAPVAAAAAAHFVVTKEFRESRTLTEIRALDGEERVTELARMMGGRGSAARRHAEALLGAKRLGASPEELG
jgi:DNA repair protein RecN (Recombination protein N)